MEFHSCSFVETLQQNCWKVIGASVKKVMLGMDSLFLGYINIKEWVNQIVISH